MARTYTDEEKAAWAAKMKAAKQAKAASQAPAPDPKDFEPEEEVITLDLTKENLVNEASVTELVRRMFDEGQYPTVIKVTSSQMMEIIWPSKWASTNVDGCIYESPFGEHWVDIIPRKELDSEAN